MRYDEIADLADRTDAMTEFDFEIEWGALTGDERDQLMALHERADRSRQGKAGGGQREHRCPKGAPRPGHVQRRRDGGGGPWLRAASPCGRSSRRPAVR